MWPFKRRDERLIFRFHDGVSQRAVDPLRVLLALDEHKEFSTEKFRDAILTNEVAGLRIGIAAIREVFKLPEWKEDGSGLTDGECIALFANFMAYSDSVKKNTNGPQITPSPTGNGHSGKSTTKPGLVSG